MKRSKLFLAATTCLLAVVGVAATKAHQMTPKTGIYYYTGTSCLEYSTGVPCTTVVGNTCLYTQSGHGSSTVYNTRTTAGKCQTPLYIKN